MRSYAKLACGFVGLLVMFLTTVARCEGAQSVLCPMTDNWTAGRLPWLAPLGPSGAVLAWIPTYNLSGTNVADVAITILDQDGANAPGWEIGPKVFSEPAFASLPQLLSLDGRVVLHVWDHFMSGSAVLHQVSGSFESGSYPAPAEVRDTVVSGFGTFVGTKELLAIDSASAFVVTNEASGYRLRKMSLGTVEADGWPTPGVGLGIQRQIGGLALDDSGGAFVADCRVAQCLMPGDPCTTTVIVRRVLTNGTPDPRWGEYGRVLAAALPRGRSGIVMSDRLGGCYAIWTGQYPYPTAVRLTRLLPDGSIGPGWPIDGLPYSSGIVNRPGRDYWERGPEAVVTEQSDFLMPALANISGQTGDLRMVLLGRSLSGGNPTGWSSERILLSDTLTLAAGPPVIASDATGRIVVAWSSPVGEIFVNVVDAQAGQLLAGWPDSGRQLCPSGGVRIEPVLLAHDDGTFTVAWSELRGNAWGVGHARFHIQDGTVATSSAAHLLDHRIVDGWLEAEWHLSNASSGPIDLLRSVDREAFALHPGLERVGQSTLRLRDRVPERAGRLRYVIRAGDVAISDTLEVRLAVPPVSALLGESIQRTRDIALRLKLGSAEDWADVALHDIAGRRLAATTLKGAAAGEHAIILAPAATRPGVLMVRARLASGAVLHRTVVLLDH